VQRSKIAQLPEALRLELSKRIQDNGFAGYEQITAWLREECASLGVPIEAIPSKTAVHKHGQQLEDIYAEILIEAQRSRAFGQAIADQQNEYGLAVLRKTLYRCDRLIETVQNAIDGGEILPESIAKSIAPLLRVVAQLNNALVRVEQFAEEVRGRAELAAEKINSRVRAEGGSEDLAQFIYEQVLGIPSGGAT
jgi:hypothetical protein